MIRILVLTFHFSYSIASSSQVIHTGDKFPEITIGNIMNYSLPQLAISDFKGKAVLIDFWNHSCTACIQSFSKLDSLQKIFAGKMQIILVNRESKDSTQRFFSKRNKIRIPDLPMVTGDKTLRGLFPLDGYPYTVWIDSAGIVRYFSGEYNITHDHIRDFLDGKELSLRDVTIARYGSLTGQKEFVYFSAISNCSDTIDAGNCEIAYTDNKKSVRMSSTCSAIADLYRKAYKEYNLYNLYTNYGLIFETKDSSNYFCPSDPNLFDDWLKSNSYNYELILPVSKEKQRYQIMQEDLNRYFDLDARIEKRKIRSVVLKNCNDCGRIRKQYREDPAGHAIESFGQFIMLVKSRLEYYYPVFDETGVPDDINVRIREKYINYHDIENLRKELLRNNVILKFEEREVPVLVIREKKK
ncbi:MAG TPA: TlpA disulfide reductase family protein [Chitinophagaceae bacterium]|nr:TlpA disulfide reductase family protein [Chitinophagaceae bacterium]